MGIKTDLIEKCGDEQHVIGLEGNFWNYKIMETEELVNLMSFSPEIAKHESIHRACKLYFDLDGIEGDAESFDVEAYSISFEKAVSEKILASAPDYVCRKAVWFRRQSFAKKISFHVIYPDVWVSDRREIPEHAAKLNLPEIDFQVYSTGMLRLPFSCKKGGDPDSRFIPLSGNSRFDRKLFLSGVVSYGPKGYMLPSLGSVLDQGKKFITGNFPHTAHIQRLITWFQESWPMNLRVSSVKQSSWNPNMYSVQNAGLTYCRIARRYHGGNTSYFHFEFIDELRFVAISVYCTDQACRKRWQFTDVDLSHVAYNS